MRPDLAAIRARHEDTQRFLAVLAGTVVVMTPTAAVEYVREAHSDRAVLLDYVAGLEARLTDALHARGAPR